MKETVIACTVLVATLAGTLWIGGYVGLRERWCILSCIRHGGTYESCLDNCRRYYRDINTERP